MIDPSLRPSPRPAGHGAYANVHYSALWWLVEEVAGISLADYVSREILEPAGLHDIAYGYPERFIPRAAKGHVGAFFEFPLLRMLGGRAASDLVGRRVGGLVVLRPYVPAEWGAGGIVGTASALARFGALHLGFPTRVAEEILDREWADAMRQPIGRIHLGPVAITCGLGWWLKVDGEDVFAEHWGRAPGFTAALRILPQRQISIALLLNRLQLDPRPWDHIMRLAVASACS